MVNRDLASNALVNHQVSAQSVAGAGTGQGTGVDKTGWRWCYVLLNCGAINTNGLTVNIQESSDDGAVDTYANVTDATFSVTDANDDTTLVGQIDCDQREAWLRADYTNGATNASVFSVDFVFTAAKDTLLSSGGVTTATFSV